MFGESERNPMCSVFPYIGHMAQLQEAVRQARDGKGRTIFVAGEAGIAEVCLAEVRSVPPTNWPGGPWTKRGGSALPRSRDRR